MIDRFCYTVSAFVNAYISLRLEASDNPIGLGPELSQALSVIALGFAVLCVVAMIRTMNDDPPVG